MTSPSSTPLVVLSCAERAVADALAYFKVPVRFDIVAEQLCDQASSSYQLDRGSFRIVLHAMRDAGLVEMTRRKKWRLTKQGMEAV